MKTNLTSQPAPRRPLHRQTRTDRPQPPTARRLYTDFLALAFYPGMPTLPPRPPDRDAA